MFSPPEDRVARHDLPRERPARGTRLSATIVVMLLTVFALNWAAHLLLQYNGRNRGYRIVRAKFDLAGTSSPVDTLLLGDSSCNQALLPSVWEEITGDSAVNLCTVGDLTGMGDVWMLERYLRRHGSPRRVVVMHVYDMWHRDVNVALLGSIPGPWGFWRRSTAPLDLAPEEKRDLFLSRHLPLWSQNTTLLAMYSAPSIHRFEVWEDGFMPWHTARPASVVADAQHHLQFVAEQAPHISPTNKRAMEALVRLQAEHGFELHFVQAPVYEGLATNLAWRAFSTALMEAGDRLTDGQAIWHRQIFHFPAHHMENADHIITDVAGEFTRNIAHLVMGAH